MKMTVMKEITVMKEQVYIHRSRQAGGTACWAGPHGEEPGSIRSKGKLGCGPLLCFLREGMGKAGSAGWTGLGLASLNDFSVLWDRVVASICPGPGCGVVWAGYQCARWQGCNF